MMGSGKIITAFIVLSALLSCKQDKLQETKKPNFILILADDLGWSDVGCYGGEISTPNIDRLAANGIRFTQFYNTAKCFPSRAALLTGQYAQAVGAHKTWRKPWQYETTIGKALQSQGYTTMWSGKHHGVDIPDSLGYDKYYGLFSGATNHFNPGNQRPGEPEPAKKRARKWIIDGKIYEPYTPESQSFYTTDAFTDKALTWLDQQEKRPFFLYMSYTAPHDPLMAWPEDIEKYKDTYSAGYDAIRKARFDKQKDLKVIPRQLVLSVPSYTLWDSLSGQEQKEEALKMAVYAAMVDRLDQNIGRLLEKLEEMGELENTVILFMSDNGSSAEVVDIPGDGKIGTVGQWTSLGKNWANVSNTPFRYYKNYSYEGGINTPFIVSGPGITNKGSIEMKRYGHFIDILPTILNLATKSLGAPTDVGFTQDGINLELTSGQTQVNQRNLFWEWQDGKAMRSGYWKIVSEHSDLWELYNLQTDPFETKNLSNQHPERLNKMITIFKEWQNQYATEEP